MKNAFITVVSCILLSGCVIWEQTPVTNQEKIQYYDAYWGSKNEAGETGWCSRKPIPTWDFTFKDCGNATPERTVSQEMCVP
jgi:hypothetical protein